MSHDGIVHDTPGDGGGDTGLMCPLDAATFQALPCQARQALGGAIPACRKLDVEACAG